MTYTLVFETNRGNIELIVEDVEPTVQVAVLLNHYAKFVRQFCGVYKVSNAIVKSFDNQ